jgi:hypothetical protein
VVNHKATAVLVLLALSALVFTTRAKLNEQAPNGTGTFAQRPADAERVKDRLDFESQFPVVNYDAPDAELNDPEKHAGRKAKNRRYDGYSFGLGDPSPHINETSIETEWSLRVEALPAAQSEVVLVGEVIKTGAHLSNNKKGIYSGFTVRVEEVLKDRGSSPLVPGGLVVAERLGGAVVYPAGNKRIIRVAGQNMPRVDRRYVFFLGAIESGQDFDLLTGYELRAGKTLPLDDSRRMSAYGEMGEDAFLKHVREAIAQTRRTEVR